MVERWAWSEHEDGYWNVCDSREEAIEEGREVLGGGSFYIGRRSPPAQPEQILDLDMRDVLDRTADDCGHEDWCIEGCEWPLPSRELFHALNADVRNVLAAWLDKHDLRPKWFVIADAERINGTEQMGRMESSIS